MTLDHEHIAVFVMVLFKHAASGSYVSLRVPSDQSNDNEPRIVPVELNGNLDTLIKQACRDAELAVTSHEMFCPPIVTFANSEYVGEQDFAEGLALSAECNAKARAKLEQLLGPASVVVKGEWTDPGIGETRPKLQVHYRLKTPASNKSQQQKLKLAHKFVAMIVGGDPVPLAHPIRWPGSLCRKDDPKLCRLVDINPDAEIDLDVALEILREEAENIDQLRPLAIPFLEKLRPGGPWVLTAIVPDGATTTITARTADQVETFVRKHDGKANLYYSVNPTRTAMGKKAAKTDIAAIEYVLGDLDPADGETSEAAKARYLEQLNGAFEPRPTAGDRQRQRHPGSVEAQRAASCSANRSTGNSHPKTRRRSTTSRRAIAA